MAKRNIARTAIEGGRAAHNRYDEHAEDRSERRAYNNYCHIARLDPELDEPGNWKMSHATGRGYRDFADKLSPVYRWLCKQVGRPWDDVYSEICQRFENRSLAGRHIIGHIEAWVNVHREPALYRAYKVYEPVYDAGMSYVEWTKVRKTVGYNYSRVNYWDFEIDEDGIMRCGETSKYFHRQVVCKE